MPQNDLKAQAQRLDLERRMLTIRTLAKATLALLEEEGEGCCVDLLIELMVELAG